MHYAQHCPYSQGGCTGHNQSAHSASLSKHCILCADAHAVCMQIAKYAQTHFRIKFQNYDQSSKCYGMSDSSVSYAAAVVMAEAGQ